MGLYASDSPEVKPLRGLHLSHFALSNCSQRVRLALEEKGLPWTSHHLNIPANEHATPEYQAINPNGVVPTLVHDGQVVIESNDILVYLEQHFPEPSLSPSDPAERAAMQERIAEAGAIQPALKALSHELLFRPFRKIGPDEVALFERSHRDAELVAFMRDYSEEGPAWQRRVETARAEMEAALDRLEAALGESEWLSGAAFGLADVSWVVNANRLTQAQYPLEARPGFRAWYGKAAARPAFEPAVAAYRP